ncbi:MAG: ATP-binding cassette domain-containing protein [Deltaproteobacteria bacterium]|nr:ATP-binding cassette domain-containing protein [Deltaproteobacteria bacterium]
MKVNAVVEARALRKTFGELVAVDDLSFTIASGECFGILGPNGAGKTSTVRMVYGFSPLTAGTLAVFGLDVTRHPRAVKARIGVCQQENNLDPELTLLQNLLVFARYFNIPAQEAERRSRELLAFMALDSREKSRVPEVSGGLLRRLAIARALLNRPELLILDEPTTGLDPQSRHQVWERLEELRADGLSILLTTHNMDEASRLCDRLIIMDGGRLLVEGKPAELVLRHVGRHILEIADPPEGLSELLKERSISYESFGHRIIISTGDGSDLYREVSERFCGSGCIMRMATLEDVFLRLTGRGLRE